ncbi:hypothetical protein AVEN_262836-1 [Araneus ventricosus]|uniref:Uncharacterized protein n=1 Tax=Araneus ventricosus TaxID=182803 RepID=A0A4Y2N5L9_ARAVE|nr:hypothetical protein AVEN_65567-1 [Araneus ventricosus]GBN33161.1 hypothetical protein AVEN_262836-1 [Araneus ventricosus]
MTRAIPEVVPSLQTSAPHRREDVWSRTYDLGCSSSTYTVNLHWNSNFKLGTLRCRSRDLTSRPQRHQWKQSCGANTQKIRYSDL